MTVENPRVKFLNKKLIVDSHSPLETILRDHQNEFDNVLRGVRAGLLEAVYWAGLVEQFRIVVPTQFILLQDILFRF